MSAQPNFTASEERSNLLIASWAHMARRELLSDMTQKFLRDKPDTTSEQLDAYIEMTRREIGL